MVPCGRGAIARSAFCAAAPGGLAPGARNYGGGAYGVLSCYWRSGPECSLDCRLKGSCDTGRRQSIHGPWYQAAPSASIGTFGTKSSTSMPL
jgi:hypothetical protein